MNSLAKTRRPASWSALSEPERDLLRRLTVTPRKDGQPTTDGLWVPTLLPSELSAYDLLLERGLVDCVDAVLRATEAGVRVVPVSEMVARRVG